MIMSKSENLTWNDNHQKQYTRLFNLITKHKPNLLKKDYDENSYLLKNNKKNLKTFINQLELGDSSKESLYFIVSTYLKINDKHNSNIKTFQEAGYKLKKTREQKDGENELDDRELISYRPYNYFMNILNSINPSNTTNEKEHMKYLLLSILIKQPPVRTNFHRTAQFRTGGSYDEKQNYIFYIR